MPIDAHLALANSVDERDSHVKLDKSDFIEKIPRIPSETIRL